MVASLAQGSSVRDDALAILARLGVPDRVFAHEGQPATSPITGDLITFVRTTTSRQTSTIRNSIDVLPARAAATG